MSPQYLNSECYGSFGPSWSTAKEVISQVRDLEKENMYVHFYDAYNNGINDYSDTDAANSNHLSQSGAVKLSRRIDSLLTVIYER